MSFISKYVIWYFISTLSHSIKQNMPQLVPFYFVNQIVFAFVILILLTYVFSKYILPSFVSLFTTRLFISKL